MTASPPAEEPTRKLTPEEWRHAVDFITSNLPLTEVRGTGLRLYLAGPRSGLSRLVPPGGTPYWAHAWPGGVALAMHLLAHPETTRGRMVYDLGTGSGLVAIAASKTGAAGVIATDPDPLSAVAALLNAGANGVPSFPVVPARSGDRLDIETHRSARRGDHAVLAGDLFYDERSTSTASAALDASVRMFGPESPILVGDIGRRFLPRDRLEPLASYPVRDVGDPPSAPLRDGWVFRWRP